MLVLALDTTSRAGSLALTLDGQVLEACSGDPGLTHGRRLPGDIIELLARRRMTVHDVELFAVAAGPGSFTGLRIGIATVQGLALACHRGVIGVSALDALNAAASAGGSRVGALIDAQRGEVFGSLYEGEQVIAGPSVASPEETLRRFAGLSQDGAVVFAGSGAELYADVISSVFGTRARIVRPTPSLAPFIAVLAEHRARAGASCAPEGLQPLYIRRPDAEIVRDRKRG
jgi:tRNA threonylcarbamoyladenosine biosynthesis protein TsaB